MNISSVPVTQQYYFNAVVQAPLLLKLQTLRDELAYNADSCPEITALKFIEKISKCFKGHIYLINIGSDIAPPSNLRAKKGALWGANELRKLDNRSFQILIDGNNTRLISLVDLKGFSYESPSKVLNWMSSMLLLSTLDLDELASVASDWVSKEQESVLPYNYDAIVKTLQSLESTAVLRYFPADNGKPESLVAVGQKNYMTEAVVPCIQNLI